MNRFSGFTFAALLVLSATQPALAHTGQHLGGFAAGMLHPLLGLDHLAVMAAVGIWAALQPGFRAAAALVGFPLFMLAGAILALAGWELPLVETMIAASVAVMGLAVSGGSRGASTLVGLLIPVFAVFHGYAHGSELPLTATPALYAAGFLAATASLHGLGYLAGRLLATRGGLVWLRLTGALTGLFGAWLLLAG